MAFEEIDNCGRPAKGSAAALPRDGVRVSARQVAARGAGGGLSRYIKVQIGADLARKASLTQAAHRLRLQFGTGEDAGKILVAVADDLGKFPARRDKQGNYSATINAPSAEGLFALEFATFTQAPLTVVRAPNCPPAFVFTASAAMLAVD